MAPLEKRDMTERRGNIVPVKANEFKLAMSRLRLVDAMATVARKSE